VSKLVMSNARETDAVAAELEAPMLPVGTPTSLYVFCSQLHANSTCSARCILVP
jgi:hypothetical protein